MSVILDCLAAGMTEREILAEYPTLTADGNPSGRRPTGRSPRARRSTYAHCHDINHRRPR